jgi:hypothetical protein
VTQSTDQKVGSSSPSERARYQVYAGQGHLLVCERWSFRLPGAVSPQSLTGSTSQDQHDHAGGQFSDAVKGSEFGSGLYHVMITRSRSADRQDSLLEQAEIARPGSWHAHLERSWLCPNRPSSSHGRPWASGPFGLLRLPAEEDTGQLGPTAEQLVQRRGELRAGDPDRAVRAVGFARSRH